MALLEAFTLASQDYFTHLAARLAEAQRTRRLPEPLLKTRQELARRSPEPDRLVAVLAARVPLLEAARPLLQALAHMPHTLDVAQGDALHPDLAQQVIAFQSVCGDARIRREYILGASYALCTALDEAAGLAALGASSARAHHATAGASLWEGRQLAPRFHGDGKGGENVFKIMANLLGPPAEHIDLLELLLIVIALGFEGMYRKATNGKRALDEIRHVLFSTVRSCRGDDVRIAHWNVIERLLWGSMSPGELSTDTVQELFQ